MTDTTGARIHAPPYAKIPQACDLLGIGRTSLFAKIGEGSIRAVKCGGRTLVDMEQALRWMSTLPQAEVAPQVRRPAAA